MQILRVRHLTRYRYARPVRFGEHTLMLRPRDDDDQRVTIERLVITPRPHTISLGRDPAGNWVAVAQFQGAADELCIESEVQVERWSGSEPAPGPDGANVVGLWSADDPDAAVERWARGFLTDARPDLKALSAMTRAIHGGFRYRRRLEHGVQPPGRTLALRSGACRDYAMLMMTAARSLGLQARFASGYVHTPAGDGLVGGGHTHAWANILVPDRGWMDFDATSGAVGSQGLVRVAVADHPAEAVPISGAYFGEAADFLGMDVEVDVEQAESPPIGAAREPGRFTCVGSSA